MSCCANGFRFAATCHFIHTAVAGEVARLREEHLAVRALSKPCPLMINSMDVLGKISRAFIECTTIFGTIVRSLGLARFSPLAVVS